VQGIAGQHRCCFSAWTAALLLGVLGPRAGWSAQPPSSDQGPAVLKAPLDAGGQPGWSQLVESAPFFQTPSDPPLGYTGPSGILSREQQTDPHFVPVEDRWRIGFPDWTRYEDASYFADAPYQLGHWWDPYNQNVLKGDYPILGQHTFFVLTAVSESLIEPRQTPFAATLPDNSTAFGRFNQFLYEQYFSLGLELFHGDAAFRPVDWRIHLTPVFNVNEADPLQPGAGNQGRTFFALEEWFIETKLADLSTEYDFLSLRVGSQPFVSDFRGFIFADVNRGARLFGNLDGNRDQFNLAVFDLLEKDADSELNTFHDRHQQLVIANWYIQDFIFPGYTTEFSVHYNHDEPTFKFDSDNNLVRPDPIAPITPHTLDVVYLGWAGDGHINRVNVDNAFYWAVGHDSHNPIADSAQDISAFMAALELSYDWDYARFHVSGFWSSGDDNPHNHHAGGFDTIDDNPNFAGGQFSYWQRQQIQLFGVNLVQRESLVPDLRSSKIEGQSNFVNPGLFLINTGVDVNVTPQLRWVNNVNVLWFQSASSLQEITCKSHIDDFIGVDLSTGIEYRPLLNNNVILTTGISGLVPGDGVRTLFAGPNSSANFFVAGFVDLVLRY
jgi:hypothetical protein